MGAKDLLISSCKGSTEAKVGLIEFLQNCSDIKISVPCNVLGKYSQQSTSRVEVGVNGSCGDDILLDCGSFWKGAPSYLVRMHYGELLSYANKTTISTIIKKLQSKGLIQVSPTFTRPQIGNRPISRQSITREVITSNQSLSPGLSKREQGVHASKDTAFHDHRGVRRSGINLPEGHSRKGFSTPAKGHNDCVIDEHTSFPGDEDFEPNIITPFKSSAPSTYHQHSPQRSSTTDAQVHPGAGSKPPCGSLSCERSRAEPRDPCSFARLLSLAERGPTNNGNNQTLPDFDWLDSHRPPKLSCSSVLHTQFHRTHTATRTLPEEVLDFSSTEDADEEFEPQHYLSTGTFRFASPGSCNVQPVSHANAPVIADLCLHQSLVDMLPPTPPSSRRYTPSEGDFDRVYFTPWYAVNDAATQTGTAGDRWQVLGARSRPVAAGQDSPSPCRAGDTASQHFEAFLQHFAAGVPHLAMTIADLHSAHGAGDPVAVKAQFYLKTCLQIKEELSELMERHTAARGRASGAST